MVYKLPSRRAKCMAVPGFCSFQWPFDGPSSSLPFLTSIITSKLIRPTSLVRCALSWGHICIFFERQSDDACSTQTGLSVIWLLWLFPNQVQRHLRCVSYFHVDEKVLFLQLSDDLITQFLVVMHCETAWRHYPWPQCNSVNQWAMDFLIRQKKGSSSKKHETIP